MFKIDNNVRRGERDHLLFPSLAPDQDQEPAEQQKRHRSQIQR